MISEPTNKKLTCIQCNAEANGNYCSNCGQKQNIPRLSIRTFFSDFLNRIYGLDGAVPNTFLGLWKHPGIVTQEYIKGIRGKYVGPVGYYFLTFTLYLVLTSLLNVDLAEYVGSNEMNEAISETTGSELTDEKIAFQKLIQQKIFANLQYFSIIFFPFFGLWAKIFFKKSGYNFLETIVLLFFVYAQTAFINTIGIIVFAVNGTSLKFFIGVLNIIYFAWATSQFYTNKVTLKSILKSILFYAVSFITSMIFILFVGGVIGVIYGTYYK